MDMSGCSDTGKGEHKAQAALERRPPGSPNPEPDTR
jgi:hypothetical protein